MIDPQIFLAHSSTDKELVRRLAVDLVARDIRVWFDEWEIRVGHSLMDKIEAGITSSAYLGIVLSRSSVSSEGWVRRELAAGFSIELEKKSVFVLPILIEDCEIPPLLRDKKYADFRDSYEDGLKDLAAAISPPDLKGHGRTESGDYLVDWAVGWLRVGDSPVVEIVIFNHGPKVPFSVSARIRIVADEIIDRRMKQIAATGFEWGARTSTLGVILGLVEGHDCRIMIEDEDEAVQHITLMDRRTHSTVTVAVHARRLGPDPETDLVFDWGRIVIDIIKHHIEGIQTAVPLDERRALFEWIKANPFEGAA